MNIFQYRVLDGTELPEVIHKCMVKVYAWCVKNGHEYILIEKPTEGKMSAEAQSDIFRVGLLSTQAPAMWWDWDAYPIETFTIPDLACQWEDAERNQAVLYSPDTAPWITIRDALTVYYNDHPQAHLERGRMWKIANACEEYKPRLFDVAGYTHLQYHKMVTHLQYHKMVK